ncbi:MAG: multidrug efflux MFS transporter [Armatimonadetes bacterium]|jgi:MFS family permease|nr:multidrug efflux MFS transporter [Armatimonadota bacterium]
MPYYRRNLYVLSVTVLLASLSWQQIIPFLPKFLKEIGGEGRHFELWVGVIFASQSLAAIVMQPFWGKLGDNFGRKTMIIRAGLCLAGVYYGMSLCQAPWQLVICRFLNGALTGFIPGSFALIATNTPEQEAPRYVAILESTSNVGLIVGPAFGAFLARLAGYRSSMALSGTAVLLSTLVVWLLVKEPNKPAPVEKTSLIQDFGIALRSPVLSSLMFAMMLTWMFASSINPFLVVHLENLRGWSPWYLPAVTYSLPGIAFVLTAYRWSRLGERWGYHRNILIGLIGGSIGAIVLFGSKNIWMFAVVYFLTGVCLATMSPAIGAITCTKVPEDFRGRAYGIQQSAGTFGALAATLIASRIAAVYGYGAIFMFIGLLFLTGALVFRTMVKLWPAD